jgi:DNA-binding beta-propeller fold protein YncE
MVYIYDRSWNLIMSLRAPSPRDFQVFGYAIDVYGDLFVVTNMGSSVEENILQTSEVYVYDSEGVLQFSLVSPVMESNLSSTMKGATGFGFDVSFSEDIILVGEPWGYVDISPDGLVHVYDVEGSLLTSLESPQHTPYGAFGGYVASDDEFILVGETGRLNAPLDEGSVYVFDYDWNLVTTLRSPDGQERSAFGILVEISGDHVVVAERWATVDGLEKAGRAHIYDTDWNLIASLQAVEPEENGQFGEEVAIGGGIVVVGERRGDAEVINEGRAYVFDLEGNLLASLIAPDPEVGAQFGSRVDTDGEVVVVGEGMASVDGFSKRGKVYVYGFGEPAVVEPVDEGEPVVEEEVEETKRGGGIPGFPLESIILGVIAVIILWRIRKF